MQKRRLLTIFIIVFVDLLGFGLILPLLPYYAETFDASSTVVGLLVASSSVAQLAGAPLLGRLSDRFGRRPILLLSITGTLIGFLMLGFARSLWVLFASRIIDGLTGGNISVVRAYITDVTDEDNRTRGMGLIGAAFGLGFIFGPAIGGILSIGGRYALPAFAAAALAAINLVAVALWLPESLPAHRRAKRLGAIRPDATMRALQRAFSLPATGPILVISAIYGLAFAVFEGVFALHAQKHLALESNETGYLLAYVGVLVAFVQGGAIGRLATRYSDQQLLLGAAVTLTLSLTAWAYAPTVLLSGLVLAPLALAMGVMSTTIHSALTKTVRADDVGGILGVSAALGSLTRAVGPAAGGVLLDVLGTWAPGIFAAILMGWMLIYALRTLPPQISTPGLEHEGSHV